MKIIQLVLGKANPNRMNGVNNVVHHISTSLKRKKINVEVWGITSSKSHDDFEREYKLKIFSKFFYRVIPSFDLIRAILKEDKETVKFHFHGAYIIEFFVCATILKIFGYKWFVTPHGAYSRNTLLKNNLLKKMYIKTLDCIYIKKSQKIQALAPKEREDILDCFPNIEVEVIPNGVNIPGVITKVRGGIEDKYFVFCGRLHRQKGLDYLLDGYLSYISSGGHMKLYIIGDGEERSFVSDFIENNYLQNKVIMLGALFNEDKNKVIASASAFVAPSRFEGFPIALLEAFSLNIPAVVSKETNFGDIVTENNLGIELENTSPEIISNALFTMEKKPNYFYDKRPQTFVRDHYSWEAVTSKLCVCFYKS